MVGTTVLNDDCVDTVLGGADNDWVLYDDGEDLFLDQESGDVVTDIGGE